MNNTKITISTIDELYPFINNYVKSENIHLDSYNEYFIVTSKFYKIETNDDIIGCFAIKDDTDLTFFALQDEYNYLALELFIQIKATYNMKSALVAGFDNLFMSLCLDDYKSLEKTGYFCFPPKRIKRIEQPFELHLSKMSDYENLMELQKSDNYFDDLKHYIEHGEMLNIIFENKLVGFAMYELGYFNENVASYSYYIHENFRGKGLAKLVYTALYNKGISEGKIGVSGCAYDNIASLNVQLNAGATSKHRTYKFIF